MYKANTSVHTHKYDLVYHIIGLLLIIIYIVHSQIHQLGNN